MLRELVVWSPEDEDALKARKMLDDVLLRRVVGILSIIYYPDGRAECVRIGETPPMMDD